MIWFPQFYPTLATKTWESSLCPQLSTVATSSLFFVLQLAADGHSCTDSQIEVIIGNTVLFPLLCFRFVVWTWKSCIGHFLFEFGKFEEIFVEKFEDLQKKAKTFVDLRQRLETLLAASSPESPSCGSHNISSSPSPSPSPKTSASLLAPGQNLQMKLKRRRSKVTPWCNLKATFSPVLYLTKLWSRGLVWFGGFGELSEH